MRLFSAIVASCAPFFFHCTLGPMAGGTLDTSNAKVAAIIHAHNGSRAAHASVVVCPEGYLPGIGADSSISEKRLVKMLFTDDTGYFAIDSIDTGKYSIEVNDGQSGATLLQLRLTIADTSTVFLDDTLHPYAGIRGSVGKLADSLPMRYLLVSGLKRRVVLGADGSFSLTNLPAGTFFLRIVAEGASGAPIGIDSVTAYSNEITALPFVGWTYRAEVNLTTTPSGADVAENVYGFPVLIRLSSANFRFNEAKGDGSDCRFAKSDNASLDFEIEQWDSLHGKAMVWVKVDTLFGNTADQTIMMLWGNPNAASAQNSMRVFDTSSGFMGTYHFGGTTNDATQNGFNGIDNKTVDTLTGIIGNGRAFDGKSQFIGIPDLPDRPMGAISFWMRPKATFNSSCATTQGIWGKKTADSIDGTVSLMGRDFYTGLGSSPAGSILAKLETPDTGYYLNTSTSSFAGGSWYYVAWTWGNGQNTLFVNGVLEKSDPHSLPVIGDSSDEIGRSFYDSSNILSAGPLYFNGTLDEFRIDKAVRSAAWVKLCYMNQRPDDKLVTSLLFHRIVLSGNKTEFAFLSPVKLRTQPIK